MENQIYLLFNRLTCRYGSIFSFPTDAFAVKVMQQQLLDAKMSLDENILYNVGSYDIASGKVKVSDPRSITWNVQSPIEIEAK